MPENGRLNPAQVETIEGSGSPAAPWKSAGTTIHAATFEVETGAALDALPPMLTRPAPTYARIYVVDYPESPVGPYREAQLFVSCRYLMLPRQYLAASIVTSEAARDANAQNSHYRSDVGQIETEVGNLSARSAITGPNSLKIVINSADGEPTGPDVLRYDPVIITQPGENGLRVLTISGAPENLRDAFIASGTSVTLSGGAGTAWSRLACLNPITGTWARMDAEVPEPSEVELPPMMAAAAARS